MSLSSLVPLAFVKSVPLSILFYKKLGFVVGNTHTPEGEAEPSWVWLKSGGAHLMLGQASDPIDPQQRAIMFYVYCDDVPVFRSKLLESGVEAGPITYPFYAPRGEFRVTDPDGVCPDGHPHMNGPKSTRPPNKGMKQTSVEHIGRSQLIPGVGRTFWRGDGAPGVVV